LDKYEYKIRAEEIKTLIAQGEYTQAAEIADLIDWRRVKSVMMLCTISDLYKINRRFEDARDMLLLAYDRHPGGRTIVYSLCELSIKMEEFVQAIEYYKEFVLIAPKDTSRYILQYKLYEAQDVGLEERIAVLEELKNKDYREKWAYELAYLYHRVGLATRCVEECDELILWFGEGKYVIKAMELKMLHEPLTPEQQFKYDSRFGSEQAELDITNAPTHKLPVDDMNIQVKTMDVGHYNTINLQKELAAGLKEVLDNPKQVTPDTDSLDTIQIEEVDGEGLIQEEIKGSEVFFGEGEEAPEEILPQKQDEPVATVVQAIKEDKAFKQARDIRELHIDQISDPEPAVPTAAPVHTTAAAPTAAPVHSTAAAPNTAPVHTTAAVPTAEPVHTTAAVPTAAPVHTTATVPTAATTSIAASVPTFAPASAAAEGDISDTVMRQLRNEHMGQVPLPPNMADVLSMESDGQIRLVLPSEERVEKQITGQLSIADILAEWERMKKERENKSKEEIRRHVLAQTGPMFTEFEASIRDGLLEQLEKEVESPEASPSMDVSDVSIPADVLVESVEEPSEQADSDGIDFDLLNLETQKFAWLRHRTDAEKKASLGDNYETGEIQYEELETVLEQISNINKQAVGQEEISQTGRRLSEVSSAVSEEQEVSEIPYASKVSEEPVVPYEPEVLEEPEVPYEPEVLEEPEVPYEPEVPEEPEVPYEPEVPEEPEVPYEPEIPEEPEIPTAPDEPSKSAAAPNLSEDDPSQYEESDWAPIRSLTKEEKERYASYVQSKAAREQLALALDTYSMEAATGNVIITGEEGLDTMTLAKSMIKQMQESDTLLIGKAVTIAGDTLNNKNIAALAEQLAQGALIIKKASEMTNETAENLCHALEQQSLGILIFMEDTKKAMDRLLERVPILSLSFNARIDIATMSNDTLVAFGRKYAKELEFAIDEMGILALHTRISDLQTSEHVVTVLEVKDIVDEAVRHVRRKTPGHFIDILLAKRYDENDMIILREKDFNR
jgi:hypothetical protein